MDEVPAGCAITGLGCWVVSILATIAFWGLVALGLVKYIWGWP